VKDYGLNVVRILQIADFIPSFPTKCLTRNKISGVYLQAPPGNTDGWFVTSVDTYTGHCGEVFLLLSTNFPNFDKWVDYDDGVDYPYNTRLVPLDMVMTCITSVKLVVMTGDTGSAQFTSHDHLFVLQVGDQELQADILRPAYRNSEYSLVMKLETDFKVDSLCVECSDITKVQIKAGGNDSWNIANVTTYTAVGNGSYVKLTVDPTVNRWIDGNQADNYAYDATVLTLTLV